MVQSDQSLEHDEIIIRPNDSVSSQYWHLGDQSTKMPFVVDTICRRTSTVSEWPIHKDWISSRVRMS